MYYRLSCDTVSLISGKQSWSFKFTCYFLDEPLIEVLINTITPSR